MSWRPRLRPRRRTAARVPAVALAALTPVALVALAGGAPAEARVAYVPVLGGNQVLPVSTATGLPGTPISLSSPRTLALTPDGGTAWVVGQSANQVTPVDTATGAPGAPIAAGAQPLGVAISPDGATAYVAAFSSGQVIPIDVASGTAGTAIGVASPFAVAVTPDGATAYATGYSSGNVTPIDLATGTAGTPIAVGGVVRGVAVAPDGATAYAISSAGSVMPIDTATHAAGPPIAIGGTPLAIAISPDGATAYVTRESPQNDLVPIDLASQTAETPIPLGTRALAIAISPDGATAYVTRESPQNDLVAIDLGSGTLGTPTNLGGNALGIAITPNQGPTAALTASLAPYGTATSFDAGGSSDLDGAIVRYRWEFGDGHTATTTVPEVTHAYAASGTYAASVTVVDDEGCSTELVYTGQTASCNGSGRARAQIAVTVDPPPPPGPVAAPIPPSEGSDPPSPPTATTPRAISRLALTARCVRPTRSHAVRVGLRLRMAQPGPLRVRVERARGSRALRRCPPPDPARRFTGRFHPARTLASVPTHASAVPRARRGTLPLRLAPGLYRVTVRAYRQDGRLSRPLRRFLRVLTPQRIP